MMARSLIARLFVAVLTSLSMGHLTLVGSGIVCATPPAEAAPMDEDHPLNPRSPYAATKAGADRLAYSYYVTYGLPVTIVRPFNNYGPRQHPEKVIPRFITQALQDRELTIHGDGHASRDWLYVDDDAEAIEAVISAPLENVAGEVLNVATGVDISVNDIADAVLDALRARKPFDARLVLRRDDRAAVGIPEARSRGVAVERDHVQLTRARRREQAQLGRPRA